MTQMRFRHVLNGEIVETELLILRPDRGEQLPGDGTVKWSTVAQGPRLFALRLGPIAVTLEESARESLTSFH